MSSTTMPSCEFDGRELILRLNITVTADPSSITPVLNGVMGFVREMGCARGKEFEVEMAIREALTNAVVHGCRNDPTKAIQFCVACDKERGMLIVVRDPGEGFDPAAIPSPVVGQNVYAEHGRGIFLINQLMDDVRFERGGTEIRMVKH